jgi:Asp-tRNA(Asn)/Glu-tRNA(Gln) amidotransferase A subunit family amidase
VAYSLNGENVHYGTPTNPRAPGRIPGGSSSGSAVAVAGGLVGFALGTDCGGSVRLPASYCGIFGIRTTHGLVPIDGVVDLAASFDTVGWFAREPQTLRRVGEVLLPAAPTFVPTRLLIADDAFAFAGPEVSAALAEAVDRLKATFTHHRHIQVYTSDPAAWSGIFRVLQGSEIWRRHGTWIDAHKPSFGPGIAERFRLADRDRAIGHGERIIGRARIGNNLMLPPHHFPRSNRFAAAGARSADFRCGVARVVAGTDGRARQDRRCQARNRAPPRASGDRGQGRGRIASACLEATTRRNLVPGTSSINGPSPRRSSS